MVTSRKHSRIGDLLLDKGAITRKQLTTALAEQKRRRQYDLAQGVVDDRIHCLGEILIQLGYISRFQLRRGLNWQLIMRKAAMAMAVMAPLMTAACGGGGGGSDESAVATSAQSVTPTPTPEPEPEPEPEPATAGPVDVSGPVTVNWDSPSSRENGDSLDLTEIGGYEIRYREAGATDYQYLVVEDGYANDQYVGDLYGSYEFEVAAYDKNGLYSQFVPART